MSTIYQLHIYLLLRNNGRTTKVFSILRNKPKFGIQPTKIPKRIYYRWLKIAWIEIGNEVSIPLISHLLNYILLNITFEPYWFTKSDFFGDSDVGDTVFLVT